jgi:ABC-type branched-subunit amino acid transport system substrate-binding protein
MDKMTHWKRFTLLAACAAAVAAVATPLSWGGGSQTGSTIKIGFIGANGTPVANWPHAIAEAKAAVKGWNSRGGLHGHKLQLVYCNDKNDPNLGSACARQMVSEKVIAVVGGGAFASGAQITAILGRSGIPQIGWNPVSGPEFNAPNIFLMSGGTLNGYQIWLSYVGKNKDRYKVVQVSADNPGATGVRTILDATYKHAGGEYTSTVLVPATAADFAPLVQSATEGNPNSVFMLVGQEQASLFIHAAESASAGFLTYFLAGSSPAYATSTGVPAKIRTYGAFLPPTANNPLMAQFRRDMVAQQKTGDKDANYLFTSDVDFSTYLGFYVVDTLTKGMTDITAASLMKALRSAKDIDMKGVMPPWTPNKPGPKGLSRISNSAMYLYAYNSKGSPVPIIKKPVTLEEALAGKF